MGPALVARHRIDDENRLAPVMAGVATLEARRLDQQCAGLGMKGDRDFVGGADFFGADALFVHEPGERRRQKFEDGGASAADIGAVAGLTFGLAQRALEASEGLVLRVEGHAAIACSDTALDRRCAAIAAPGRTGAFALSRHDRPFGLRSRAALRLSPAREECAGAPVFTGRYGCDCPTGARPGPRSRWRAMCSRRNAGRG
jgi:hypothetical protein